MTILNRKISKWLACCALAAVFGFSTPIYADVTDLVQRIDGWLSASRHVPLAPGSIGRGSSHRLVFNGQMLHALTGRTNGSIRDVLDHCQSIFPGGALKKLAGRPVAMRRDGDLTGELLTIEVSSESVAKELMDGKRTLLSAGPLHMAYARRVGSYTDYLIVWSERPVPEDAVDPPAERDAPGTDLPDVPRPPGAVRTLSFADQTTGYSLVQYRVPMATAAALALASERLRTTGFSEDAAFTEATREASESMRVFSRPGAGVMVRARPLSSGSQVVYVLDTH